ncbi:MAG: hypothetical protein ACLFPX_03450 [Candidatus Omnitrophota bacterium]
MNVMTFTYGEGKYTRGPVTVRGQILLNEHKLFLRCDGEDLTQTFVPLEKIQRVQKGWSWAVFRVIPSPALRYEVRIETERQNIRELVKDVARLRQLQSRFFGFIWEDRDFFTGRP